MRTGRIGWTVGLLGLLMLVRWGGLEAAEQSPVRVSGEIASVDGRQMTVQTRDGGVARLELAEDARILGMAPIDAATLGDDATIGAAVVEQPDGRMKALMVVLYPESLGGEAAGYITWDVAPDSTMVHGAVRSNEAGPDGRVLSIYYPQAGATLVIPPETPVVRLEPAGQEALAAGAHVFVPNAEQGSHGDTHTAEVVAVGKDGFKPPM